MIDKYDELAERLKDEYTLAELAEMLNISVYTLGNWLREADIQAVRTGKRWRVKKEAVIQLLRHRQFPIF